MNIAVFLDGTWSNTADGTNVAQLHARAAEDASQRRHYDAGVGTAPFQKYRGGILGLGLDENVKEGYAFVARHYSAPSDRIFLIGFSRGAFTARSLGGMIARCGIVAAEDMDADAVYDRYRRRDPPAAGLRELRAGAAASSGEDRHLLAHATLARIRFVGVFDTVGHLGIPGRLFGAIARRRYGFHDTRLSALVDHARHALAIDEWRRDFTPTMWDAVPTPVDAQVTTVVQAWYAGSHGDVGGGPGRDLSTLTRDWMADEAAAAGLVIAPPPRPPPADAWAAPIRDSHRAFLGGLYRRFSPRHERPLRTTATPEELAGSALRRWRDDPGYRPGNPGLAELVRELGG